MTHHAHLVALVGRDSALAGVHENAAVRGALPHSRGGRAGNGPTGGKVNAEGLPYLETSLGGFEDWDDGTEVLDVEGVGGGVAVALAGRRGGARGVVGAGSISGVRVWNDDAVGAVRRRGRPTDVAQEIVALRDVTLQVDKKSLH